MWYDSVVTDGIHTHFLSAIFFIVFIIFKEEDYGNRDPASFKKIPTKLAGWLRREPPTSYQ